MEVKQSRSKTCIEEYEQTLPYNLKGQSDKPGEQQDQPSMYQLAI